jgi:hypothetical protein
MTGYAAEQNLRLARKMLDQQGEINALAAALSAVTHRWQLPPSDLRPGYSHAAAMNGVADPCWICGRAPDDPDHRTPARVRAELEAKP